MDIYASDEEKGEDIKRWWRENGLSVIAGVILGVAILLVGIGYHKRKCYQQMHHFYTNRHHN